MCLELGNGLLEIQLNTFGSFKSVYPSQYFAHSGNIVKKTECTLQVGIA